MDSKHKRKYPHQRKTLYPMFTNRFQRTMINLREEGQHHLDPKLWIAQQWLRYPDYSWHAALIWYLRFWRSTFNIIYLNPFNAFEPQETIASADDPLIATINGDYSQAVISCDKIPSNECPGTHWVCIANIGMDEIAEFTTASLLHTTVKMWKPFWKKVFTNHCNLVSVFKFLVQDQEDRSSWRLFALAFATT